MRSLVAATVLTLAAGSLPAAEEEARALTTFKALELELMTAVREGDTAAVDALVSAEFAWAIAFVGRPQEVMNRAEWMAGGRYIKLEGFDVGALVAEQLGQVAVVNFRLNATGMLGSSAELGGPYVVTDIWRMEQKKWKLLRRYLSAEAPLPQRK